MSKGNCILSTKNELKVGFFAFVIWLFLIFFDANALIFIVTFIILYYTLKLIKNDL